MSNQNDIEENVEEILKKHPHTRSNDLRLIFIYWLSVDQIPQERWLNLHFNLTKPSSILRARRAIQQPSDPEAGKYEAEPETQLTRQEKQEYFKKHYRGEEEWS